MILQFELALGSHGLLKGNILVMLQLQKQHVKLFLQFSVKRLGMRHMLDLFYLLLFCVGDTSPTEIAWYL